MSRYSTVEPHYTEPLYDNFWIQRLHHSGRTILWYSEFGLACEDRLNMSSNYSLFLWMCGIQEGKWNAPGLGGIDWPDTWLNHLSDIVNLGRYKRSITNPWIQWTFGYNVRPFPPNCFVIARVYCTWIDCWLWLQYSACISTSVRVNCDWYISILALNQTVVSV